MRRFQSDALIGGLLFILPLLMFWAQTLGGQSLIPAENLYTYEPFATYREQVGAPGQPHNALVSDLILQNYQWKAFIRESIDQGEIPLWNPHQFSGIPFMAAGQQSTLYPLSVVYYVMPLHAAYGWFTVLNLWLAGVFMVAFLRGIGLTRIGATLAAIAWQLSGFLIASAVHPMIIGAAAWLPLILLMVEFIIRRRPIFGQDSTVPWVLVGAAAIACNIFAGHAEITIYTLLIAGYYAAARLLWEAWQGRASGLLPATLTQIKPAAWLLVMVLLGLGLAGVQFIPLYEFANTNWRAERGDLDTVLSYAHPWRDLLMYLMPNFYGSPVMHSYTDIFSGETIRAIDAIGRESIDWGMKNYVEGALYIGILPLVLAAYALLEGWQRRKSEAESTRPPYLLIFLILTLVSVTFMFGMKTYAVIYVLPGVNQLNTAFRWVYGVSLGLTVLAAFGADALTRLHEKPELSRLTGWLGAGLMALGLAVFALLGIMRLAFDSFEPLFDRIVNNAAKASEAFSDGRMFFSYELPQIAIFGLMLLLSGLVIWLATRGNQQRRLLWQGLAVIVLAADLLLATRSFNPASDPELLDFTPPSIQWLIERQDAGEHFRYVTIDAAGQHLPLFQANATLRYGLDDVRGYDSIIPEQYVDFMRRIQVQPQLDFNRVAPLYLDRLGEVDWERLRLLNVRYLISHRSTQLPETGLPELTAVYEDEAVRIYEMDALPRASLVSSGDDSAPTLESGFEILAPASISRDTGREKFVDIALEGDETQWLVISETHQPGWRAFVRPQGASDSYEKPLTVELVLENLQGIRLNPAEIDAQFAELRGELDEAALASLDTGQFTLRVVYSPTSFQVGMFASVISAALLVFLAGVWLWRFLVGVDSEDASAVSRVARNSVAPIVLNLFNRGIDFAFAFVMLRILGPEDAGIYYYAIIVFVWFDIFTNFGLDVFLIREASRHRERAGYFFLNTSYMRFLLVFACVPLLFGFLLIRQATVEPQLSSEALVAIGLLYIGLAPGSLSKGLTSLFYAFEKAEYPAAVTTITTINKAVFGLIALLLGYGIVGLAAVSIGVNLLTLAVLVWAGRGLMRGLRDADGRLKPDQGMLRGMVGESWPLMLNHFLATVFFQIDIVLLEAIRGARIVGQYSVAYRWLLALNIIPAFFTQALLPVMSRQAQEDPQALRRSYSLGVKLLVAIAVPLAVAFTFMAEGLVLFLGGPEFMPAGAIALQIMIWSIPIGWINSLTQYALIAVNLQRSITRAFFIAVSFNIITNLIFIPQFGYQAAAITTILSEAVLLIPFGLLLQKALGKLAWADMVWRPVVAGAAMFGLMLLLWPLLPLAALIMGPGLYVGLLLLLRPLNAEEENMLRPLLPGRLRRVLRFS